MTTREVYDDLAANYLSPGRRSTTTVFREIQRSPIREMLLKVGRTVGYFSEMKYLIVGAGPLGNLYDWLPSHQLIGHYLDEVDPSHPTYVDASPVILEHCRRFVSDKLSVLAPSSAIGEFVCGFAEALTKQVPRASQHVVIAGLCDHFQTDVFFRECADVLRPGGVLITTFPADTINATIRREIYKIPETYTRFMVDGEVRLVPSRLMNTEALSQCYLRHGFKKVRATNVMLDGYEPSPTLLDASQRLGQSLQDLPILVAGIGYKP
jgi:SAM-dependent methyltransferase